MGKCAHGVEAPHRQGIQAFTQRSFQRGLPTRFNVHLGPQTGQPFKAMFGQPRLQTALRLHLGLQRTQRVKTRGDVGQLGRFAVDRFLRLTSLRVKCWQLRGQFLQPALTALRLHGRGPVLVFQTGQTNHVGGRQTAFFCAQFFTPRAQLARLLFHVAAVGRQHLNLLLHLRHGGTLLIALGLRSTHGIFQRWHVRLLLAGLLGLQSSLRLRTGHLLGQVFHFGLRAGLALCPLLVLRLQLGHPRLRTVSAFDHVTNALFQAADFQ